MIIYFLSLFFILIFGILISLILLKISKREDEMANYIFEKSLSKTMLQTIGLLILNLLANIIGNIFNIMFLKSDIHYSSLIVVIIGLVYINLLIEKKKLVND